MNLQLPQSSPNFTAQTLRKPPHLLDWALYYAGLDWHVFPCDIEKQPLTAHGFQDATTDADRIRYWFTSIPKAVGIGIRTGKESGLVALDVDVKEDPDPAKNVNGWIALKELQGKHGILPATLTAVSGARSGGGHFFFSMPPDGPVPCSQSLVGNGLDMPATSRCEHAAAPRQRQPPATT